MKVLKGCVHKDNNVGHEVFDIDGKHDLIISIISDKIFRVSIRKNRSWRLGSTWAVNFGKEDIPYEGNTRDYPPPSQDYFQYKDNEVFYEDLKITLHQDPLALEWNYKGETLFSDRKTGAYYLGVRDHKHEHYIDRVPNQMIFGLGEKSGPVNKAKLRYEMKNLDAMGYDAEFSDPLYKHIPFYISKRESTHFGIFYDNFSFCEFNFGKELDNYHGHYNWHCELHYH